MLIRQYSLIVTIFIFILSLTITGCASTEVNEQRSEPDKIATDTVTATDIEKVDSTGARVVSAYLNTTDEGTVLIGKIIKRYPGRGAIPGHLHVEIINPNGKVVQEAEIDYKRVRRKSRYSQFSIQLPGPISRDSRIRVTHHDLRSHKSTTSSSSSPWKKAQQVR